MKDKITNFFNNANVKMVLILLGTLLLIMVSIILFADVGLDNTMLIYNIFGTLALVGFLYSFHITKRKLYSDLALGRTRKQFFYIYLKNIFFVLGIASFLVVYYILVYKLIIDTGLPLLAIFDFKKIISLPAGFIALSFLGFTLGILKMNSGLFYTLASIIAIISTLSIIYISFEYLLSIVIVVFTLILGGINYCLIRRVNV